MKRLDSLSVPLRGTHLVEASAGTGKTYTLATLYLRLLLEEKLTPREILVVTYTNAATAELRARIRQRLVDALAVIRGGEAGDPLMARLVLERRDAASSDLRQLTGALYAFDEAAIFTIHGFCQRVLVEHAFESGASFDCELLTDQTPIVDEVVRDFWARELYQAPEPFIRSLLASREGLQTFAALVEKVVPHRDVPILPPTACSHLDDVLRDWGTAHRKALEIWNTEREAIVDLLERSCERLHRNAYRAEAIAGMAKRLDVEIALARPGIARRFPRLDRFAAKTLAVKTKKNHDAPQHPFFDACESLLEIEGQLDEQLGRRLLSLKLDLLGYASREIELRKEASNTQFFDDLLYRLDGALGRSDGAILAERVRRRFRAALIDEFQDTDPLQYRIFHRLYHDRKESTLFLVGDPKQAIYAFRGADVFAYIEAKRDAGEWTHTLDINWRADPSLMRAINTLFGAARAPFLLREIPFVPGEAKPDAKDRLAARGATVTPLEVLFLPRDRWKAGAARTGKGMAERELPGVIAAEISHFLASRATIDGQAVRPSDIAVLCRTNSQANGMQDALRALRVPSVLQGDASVFDAPEAAELEQMLRAMAEPGDAAALRAALVTPMVGRTGHQLLALQDSERDWEAWSGHFQRWHDVWLRSGFMQAFRRMLDDCDAAARLLRLVDGERRLTNLLHLGELLQTAVKEARRGPLAIVEWLAEMRSDVRSRSEVGGEAAQVRLESDLKALKLTTVHKSKGLEYPIVYCPFLYDGRLLSPTDKTSVRFHDPDDDYRLKFDLGSPDKARHHEQAEREALAENLRLLYVATTRARHRCTVVWGAVFQPEHSALGYLLHQPAGEPTLDAITAWIKGLDDDSMRDDLNDFVARSASAIEVRDLTTRPGIPYDASTTERVPLRCRTADRALPHTWRIGSFSSLTAQPHRTHLSREAEEGADYDEDLAARGSEQSPHPKGTVVLHDFPAGARPGRLIHEILEHLDFEEVDSSAIGRRVETTMRHHGFDPKDAHVLTRGVRNMLATPLDEADPPLRLARIPMQRRLNEMEFVFPVANSSDGSATFDSGRLADLLASSATDELSADYIDQVRRLGFAPLAGYLKGYIDLVFEHDGLWYVVDYKSNRLGTRTEDYAPHRLRAAMRQHHYFLQSYFYGVAVHRHLRLRLPGYDYDRHFGGILYLFLRGMAPEYPPGHGIFRSRPPRRLMEGLSTLLANPEGAQERHGS